MSLIDEFKVPCVMLEKTRVADGEGGFTTAYVDGVAFEAAIGYNSSLDAKVAEKDGVTSLWTVTTAKNCTLEYHDVFKRVSDGKVFRVTSDGDDILTPEIASFSFSQVSAEEWTLA